MSADDLHARCLRKDESYETPHWGDETFNAIDASVTEAFRVMPEYRNPNGLVDSTWVCETVERLFGAVAAYSTPELRYTAMEAVLRALLHGYAWGSWSQPSQPSKEVTG
jgi:hypothetical protein